MCLLSQKQVGDPNALSCNMSDFLFTPFAHNNMRSHALLFLAFCICAVIAETSTSTIGDRTSSSLASTSGEIKSTSSSGEVKSTSTSGEVKPTTSGEVKPTTSSGEVKPTTSGETRTSTSGDKPSGDTTGDSKGGDGDNEEYYRSIEKINESNSTVII
jgi:hypothetical protein